MMQKQLQRFSFFQLQYQLVVVDQSKGFFFFLGFCGVGGLAILLKRNEPNAKFG